jgi:uncharacterized protein (UPF0335 family)
VYQIIPSRIPEIKNPLPRGFPASHVGEMLQPRKGNFMSTAKLTKTNAKLAVVKPHGFHEVDDSDEAGTVEVNGETIPLNGAAQRFARGGSVSAEQLKSIIQRVEKLEEEKAALGADIRDVFAEAKGNGFDVKAIKQILKIRRMDESEREEQTAILETYMGALGMLPLFEGMDGEKA